MMRRFFNAIAGLAVFLALPRLTAGPADDFLGPGERHGEWFASAWMGWVYIGQTPWVYRPGQGWLYLSGQTNTTGTRWFYDADLGWIYTRQEIYPNLFRYSTHSWLYFYPETTAPGWYYDFALRDSWREGEAPGVVEVSVHRALWEAENVMRETVGAVTDYNAYPEQTEANGQWRTSGSGGWTAGFWPGQLWLMSEFTDDPYWKTQAANWTSGLAAQKDNTSIHDLGFMLYCSFGQGWRLEGREDYASVLLDACGSLASRFNPKVGAIRSWSWGRWDDNGRFTVIVDNLMNLELLFWGAAQSGGDPAWKTMAMNHADTTLTRFVRADDSTYHVVVFDETSGAVRELTTHQGYSDESAWARGQAWAIHGFTTCFRETGELRYLEAAEACAGYFLENLPADGIPYWDFEAPAIPNDVRDSSAAAVAASGLLELARLLASDRPTEAEHYRERGERLLLNLLSPTYFRAEASTALLAHGTANWPAGNRDTGLSYGDYYLLEALLRYLALIPER